MITSLLGLELAEKVPPALNPLIAGCNLRGRHTQRR